MSTSTYNGRCLVCGEEVADGDPIGIPIDFKSAKYADGFEVTRICEGCLERTSTRMGEMPAEEAK